MTETPNALADTPSDRFRILGACNACSHTNWLDRSITPALPLENYVSEQHVAIAAVGIVGFGLSTLTVEDAAMNRSAGDRLLEIKRMTGSWWWQDRFLAGITEIGKIPVENR